VRISIKIDVYSRKSISAISTEMHFMTEPIETANEEEGEAKTWEIKISERLSFASINNRLEMAEDLKMKAIELLRRILSDFRTLLLPNREALYLASLSRCQKNVSDEA
jgi:hypothetical protein